MSINPAPHLTPAFESAAKTRTTFRRPSRLLLMGPPGAGKRTQGVDLAHQLDVPALSSGELFRNMMCDDTPFAARLRDVVAHGGFVDDDTANAAVGRRLTSKECAGGFVIYGYPRTLGQVRHLDQVLEQQGAQLDAVVYFELDDDELVNRLLAREQQLRRIDDRADTIRTRLGLFHEQTQPLIDLYSARGLVTTIDASGAFHDVKQRLGDALVDR